MSRGSLASYHPKSNILTQESCPFFKFKPEHLQFKESVTSCSNPEFQINSFK